MIYEKNNMLDSKMKELIAIGASVACNCHPCVKFHTEKARQMAIDKTKSSKLLRWERWFEKVLQIKWMTFGEDKY